MRTQEILLSIIENSCEHLTADMIYMEAKKIHPSISVGTVYRNLAHMAEHNVVGYVSMPQGPARYDKVSASHPHGKCPICGDVFDICSEEIDKAIKSALGCDNCSYQLTVSCLCEKCRENGTNAN